MQSTIYLSRSSQEQAINVSQPCIGLLYLEDTITASRPFKQKLQSLINHPLVKGIVLVINSGGGSAASSWEIFESLKQANTIKPIVSYVETMCASGAYLAAVATSKIVAGPIAILGSIGVIRTIEQLEPEEFKRDGMKGKIKIHRFKAGKFKQLGNSYDPLTEEAEIKLQELTNFIYEKFCSDVSIQRNLPIEHIKAQEGIDFPGVEAKKLGFIDQIGDLSDAIALLQAEMLHRGTPFSDDIDLMQSIIHAE